MNCDVGIPKGERKYCNKHKKGMECSECQKEVGDIYYSITIGDKLERDYNEGKKFNLCQNHWQQKKESYKEQFSQGKIEVLKCFFSKDGDNFGTGWLTTCKSCQKWSDEYEGAKQGGYIDNKFCSAACQKQYDNLFSQEKENLKASTQSTQIPSKSSHIIERERERERERANLIISREY